MKETELASIIKEIIGETVEAVQEVFDEEIKPLVKFGSPQEVIGKPYEQWDEQDFYKAQSILPKIFEPGGYVAGKEVDALLEMEKEV